jgi:uncharacterized protein with GYD domain
MAKYLFQATHTSEAWAAQVRTPQNRVEMIRPVIAGLGGHIASVYYAFGEYDMVGIVEMPHHVSMAACALAAATGGAAQAIKTIPLMTVEDGLEALRKASSTGTVHLRVSVSPQCAVEANQREGKPLCTLSPVSVSDGDTKPRP